MSLEAHDNLPAVCEQAVYAYKDEGGIAKMIANHLKVTKDGQWLLPFWREMGGQATCNTHPELHGVPGLLVSPDQVSTAASESMGALFLQW